jgi:hypothetical protein
LAIVTSSLQTHDHELPAGERLDASIMEASPAGSSPCLARAEDIERLASGMRKAGIPE